MAAPVDIDQTGYSVAERDWRWQRVRNGAAQAGFDGIFVPLCVDGRNLHLSLEQARGTRSDSRFLTGLENAAVILPTDGREPLVISDQEIGNHWIPELRPVKNSWGESMAQALLDAGMERARIGSRVLNADFTLTAGHFTVSSITPPTPRRCAVCLTPLSMKVCFIRG